MKRSILLLLLTVVVLSGCKKDKDDDASVAILGKWYISKTVEMDYENSVKVFEETDTDYDNTDFFVFKENGVLEVSGDDDYKYSLNANATVLTIDSDDYPIKALDANSLVFYMEDTEVSAGVTYKYYFEYVLRR